MRSWFSGRHLHNQIVVPLVMASIFVGVVATLIAVNIMSRMIGSSIATNAISTVDNAYARLDARTQVLRQQAEQVANDPRLIAAIESADERDLSSFLVRANGPIDADNMMLVDSSGKVLSVIGSFGVVPGDRPLDDARLRAVELKMDYPSVIDIKTHPTVTVFEPVWNAKGEQYTLALSDKIDDAFLDSVTTGLDAVFCFYTGDRLTACTIEHNPNVARALAEAVRQPAASITEARKKATVPGQEAGKPVTFRLDKQNYVAAARKIQYDFDTTPSYLLTVLDTAVESRTSAVTTRLIVFWSSLAVLVLVGLGFMVAQRVSRPLTDLTEGARKVSAGDFTAKVKVSGHNEVAQLAESFNQMTDSLKERTESLTRKVIELTTLREMSRAMGTTLDLTTLLDSVLDSAMRMLNAESGYVMLRDKDTGTLRLQAWRGAGMTRPDERAIRSSLSEWVIREGRPLIFNPPQDEEERHMADSVTGALAALCVPLVSSEGTIGAITVGSHSPEFRFTADDVRLLSTIANQMAIAVDNAELFSSLQDAYIATVRSLAAAVDAKDPYTRGHSDDVAQYALAIGERMGLSQEQRVSLEMAAYLHDIGKIGIPEGILRKPGKLTALEMKQMRHHPLIGANILSQVAFPWPIAPIVRHHHERWDGGGYPAGLKGDEIPLLARILTAADAFEAMTSDRPYRRASTEEQAVEELRRCSGSHFDPAVVEAFIAVLNSLQRGATERPASASSEPQPDEARAVFVAVCDEMMANFRRLGGPRLAVNLEEELNRYFQEQEMSYEFSGNHLTVSWDGDGGFDQEVESMRLVIRHMVEGMEHVAGHSLVDHFYSKAVDGLSERLSGVAASLDLYERG